MMVPIGKAVANSMENATAGIQAQNLFERTPHAKKESNRAMTNGMTVIRMLNVSGGQNTNAMISIKNEQTPARHA